MKDYRSPLLALLYGLLLVNSLFLSFNAPSANKNNSSNRLFNDKKVRKPQSEREGRQKENYETQPLTAKDVEKFKSHVGVQVPRKNYNEIINGHGTGFAPPTTREYRALQGSTMVTNVNLQSKSLSQPVDLSETKYFPPVGDQGAQGSCASWSTAYYANTYLQAKAYNYNASSGNREYLMSPAWTYNKVNRGGDYGSSIRGNMQLIKTVGNANLTAMPYNDSNPVSWGNVSAWRNAPRYRASGFQFTEVTNIAVIKSWINAGYLVSFALDAYQYQNGFEDGNAVISSQEYRVGTLNHGNTIVGYNDSKADDKEQGAFKVVNSWGADWGPKNNGFYYMTYDCFKTLPSMICYRYTSSEYGTEENYVEQDNSSPSLLASWNFSETGSRNTSVKVGLTKRKYTSPVEIHEPFWDGASMNDHNFPPFMCLDISAFKDEWKEGAKANHFYLDIGKSAEASTVSSFRIEAYGRKYVQNAPIYTSFPSPDVPATSPTRIWTRAYGSNGVVRLDRKAYGVEDTLDLHIKDMDLNQTNKITAIVNSSTEEAGEEVNLSQTSQPALFNGTLNMSTVDGEKVLTVESGDRITVNYSDTDIGNGTSKLKRATAYVGIAAFNPSPANNSSVYTPSVPLTINVSAPGDSTLTVQFYNASNNELIDNDTVSHIGEATVKWQELEWNRTHRWYVNISNGNTSMHSATWTFTPVKDTLSPNLTILTPENGATLNVSDVEVRWTGSDNIDINYYEVRRDSVEWMAVGTSTSYTFSNLPEGGHTINIRAVDYAGNTNRTKLTLTVDLPLRYWADPGANGNGLHNDTPAGNLSYLLEKYTLTNKILTLKPGVYNSSIESFPIILDDKNMTVQPLANSSSILITGDIQITADNVTIQGVTIKYGSIILKHTIGSYVQGNYIRKSSFGLLLMSCNETVIMENTFWKAHMYVTNSYQTLIKENFIRHNGQGITLEGGRENQIMKNTFKGCGVLLEGAKSALMSFQMENNTVNGKPLRFYKGREERFEVPSNTGQVVIVNCLYGGIENLHLSNTTVGIQILYSYYCEITKNVFTYNRYDIRLFGSVSTSVKENQFSGLFSFYVLGSVYSTIDDNTFEDGNYGLILQAGRDNSIKQNSFTSNWYGVFIVSAKENTLERNNFTANSISTFLSNAEGNNIKRNDMKHNDYGVLLSDTKSNIVRENKIKSNQEGIHLTNSTNTSVRGNFLINNSEYGIYLWNSTKNKIYQNTFQTNEVNANDTSGRNWFNNSEIGNYWGDYNGSDADEDGIGDTPYNISGAGGSKDYLPSMRKLDIIPPLVEIYAPRSLTIEGGKVTIKWEMKDKETGINHCDVKIDNEGWVNVGNSSSYTFSQLSADIHAAVVKVTDNRGNTAIDSLTFVVMKKLPIIPLAISISGAIGIAAVGFYLYKKKVRES